MVNNRWYHNIPFYESEKELIYNYYPTLDYSTVDNKIKIEGELFIKEINDSYSIEILFPDDYPNILPIVREVSNDIPQTENRHINGDGSCCLCIPQLEKYYFPNNSNIKQFLENLVIPFFANQAYFDIYGKWLTGEYNHGHRGIYDFYSEYFNVLDINIIVRFIKLTLSSNININKKCLCNSNRPIKKCHLFKINNLKIIHQKNNFIKIYIILIN